MKIEIEVEKVKGECPLGHRIGDRWIVEDAMTPEGLCMHAFYVLYPWIQVMRMGGKILWEEDGKVKVPCIDEKNLVVFSLRRIEDEE